MGSSYSRLGWVDVAKGVGILLVVYGHVARGMHAAGVGLPESLFAVLDKIIYGFHMPLFFVLSGLFFRLSYSKLGAKGLLASKFDTIFYPYLLWSLIQGFLEIMGGGFKNTVTHPADVVSVLWNPRAQFWFLYSLAISFALAVVFFVLERSGRGYLFGFLSIVCFFMPNTGVRLVDLTGAHLIYFYLGSQLGIDRFSGCKVDTFWALLFVAIAAASHFVAVRVDFGLIEVERFWDFVVACASIAAVVCVSKVLPRRASVVLSALGRNSMPVYLMHIIFSGGVRIVLDRFLGVSDPILHLVFGVFFGVAGPLCVNMFLVSYGVGLLYSAPRFFSARRMLVRFGGA